MKTHEKPLARLYAGPAFHCALLMAALLLAPGISMAGDLYPADAPAPTMKNLQEIFDQAAQANRASGGGDALLFFPYLLERLGTISTTPYTFDTTIHLVATGSLTGQGLKGGAPGADKTAPTVTVNLYLYTNNGQPATGGGGGQVANPATFELGPATPKVSISLETLFLNAGGFPSSLYVGYGVLSISSGDWSDVSVEGLLINAHTGPGDLSVTPLKPVRVQNTQAPLAKDAAAPSAPDSSAAGGAGKRRP